MNPQEQSKDWFGRNWKWFIPLSVLLALGSWAACLAFGLAIPNISSAISNSTPVYQQALKKVRESPTAQRELGSPIRGGDWSGIIDVPPSSGKAKINFPVTGSRGSGRVYVEAEKRPDGWVITKLELEFGGERTDLVDSE